ncbi:DUF2218 domain-containing protein [Sphingomonas solaris]|uniref:DUF2218 domain-containing protein n=1 Tax=Alterirhizorhabdus solaris TaxID=2529389 RepID=A0A558R6X8_9SPHN|nr:DUF2218 domain-containing protein [Sphingomonas solaris]TVV75140.1 DUF2218 domain-containing protein [Sphingomonas solaris]
MNTLVAPVLVAQVPTQSGSRYLQQLCKHWSHKFAVDFTPEQGMVPLPFGRLDLIAHPDTLEVRIAPTSPDVVDKAKEVVASHLDRFAFREAPLAFDWREEG